MGLLAVPIPELSNWPVGSRLAGGSKFQFVLAKRSPGELAVWRLGSGAAAPFRRRLTLIFSLLVIKVTFCLAVTY